MRTFFDPVRTEIATLLHSRLAKMGVPLDRLAVFEAIVRPPNSEMGDLAFGCFPIAKTLKKSPAQVASELAAQLPPDDLIAKVSAAGPYLNFDLQMAGVGRLFFEPLLRGELLRQPLLANMPRAMIEFCQPNTHKELHVGHMRNACLGDALVRLLRFAGQEVVSSTFPGDMGTHVAKCLWYLKHHNQEPMPATDRGEWLGRMYSRASIKLEDEVGTAQETQNREQLTEILQQLEAKQGEFFELWKMTREWSVTLMHDVYRWANIQFDKWYWESEMDSPSLAYVKELLAEGKLIVSQGAVGMDLSADNLGFCMLLKSDGTGLYATKDLELARRKFQENHIEQSIYVVDMRQALHFKQVFKVLEKLGFEQAKKCFHLQYNYVELPEGPMSSRKGNIVPLMVLVKAMEKMVREKYLSRYAGEWAENEIQLVSQQVAKGAIKYGMVKIDSNKKIVFDLEDWLKIDGDSGPFIQYSAARINSLIRKLSASSQGKVDWSCLVDVSEKRLMQQILQFQVAVAGAAENLKPSLICTYLFELAQSFNHFYHHCSIGQAETETLRATRLELSRVVGVLLNEGLCLLGIPTPDRM